MRRPASHPTVTATAALSTFVLSLLGTGCADVHGVQEAEEAIVADGAALQTAPFAALTPRTVDVRAAGDGCRPGTWEKDIPKDTTPDARTAFTLYFFEYSVVMEPQTTVSTLEKNCTLIIDMEAPDGYRYAVTDLVFTAWTWSDGNIKATLRTSYNFQGVRPLEAKEQVLAITEDETFYTYQIPQASQNWSDCSAKRALEVNTRLTVQRTKAGAQGGVKIEKLSGQNSTPSAIKVNVELKPCLPS